MGTLTHTCTHAHTISSPSAKLFLDFLLTADNNKGLNGPNRFPLHAFPLHASRKINGNNLNILSSTRVRCQREDAHNRGR